MALSEASRSAREALTTLGRRYHQHGWLFGTSGNLSARVPGPQGPRVVVTASGKDKGALTPDDFVEVALDGTVLAAPIGERPSAETSIHLAVYQRLPEVHASLHVHTVASTLLEGTGATSPPTLTFSDVEMIKGWGLWETGASAQLPIFHNHADVPTIAMEIDAWLSRSPAVPALVIKGHGITAWGGTIFEAHRHLEVTEFLCQLAGERRRR